MEMSFIKENRTSRVNFIPFIGLRGSPFRWKGCLGEWSGSCDMLCGLPAKLDEGSGGPQESSLGGE
jgi:hypothetical protein